MSFKNSTFTISNPVWANACVGDNGNPQIINYAEGFIKAASLLINKLIEDKCRSLDVDAFIYPICFNMRHGVELHLKGAIENLRTLAMHQRRELSKFSIVSTHDLGIAWKFILKNAPLIDKRFLPILTQLKQYIGDIAEVDLTGQVFRYPYDVGNQKHLVDVGNINIIVLKQRLDELAARLSKLNDLNIELIAEYECGSFTSKLSRQELLELASKLPKRSQWGGGGFTEVKTSLMAAYKLSSNDFSRALSMIQDNYEMSQLIAAPLGLEAVDELVLHTFFDFWVIIHDIEKVRNPKPPESFSFTDFDHFGVNANDIKNQHIKRRQWWADNGSVFTVAKVSELNALYYFAECGLTYSEHFKLSREQFKTGNNIDRLQDNVYHLLKKTHAMSGVLNSLNFLGQTDLVNGLMDRYDLKKYKDQILWRSNHRKWSPTPTAL
jgi:hypothetical protein